VIAAMMHRPVDRLGEGVARRAQVVALDGADGAHRAGDQRQLGAAALRGVGRLAADAGGLAGGSEACRRHPAAGAAIDAAGVDEEIAGDIGRQAGDERSHGRIIAPSANAAPPSIASQAWSNVLQRTLLPPWLSHPLGSASGIMNPRPGQAWGRYEDNECPGNSRRT